MGRLFDNVANTSLQSATTPFPGGSTVGTVHPMTMSAWIKPVSAIVREQILGVYDISVNNQWHALLIQDTGTVQMFTRQGGGSGRADTTTIVTANVWQHACAVLNSTVDRRAYLDNRGEGINTTDIASGSALDAVAVGEHRDSSPGRNFTGDIAELGIWNIALSFFERDQLARWRYSPLLVRREHLIWYRSFRFPDLNFDPPDLLPPQLRGNNRHLLFNVNAAPAFGAHPPGIVYPIPDRTAILSAGVSVGITDGEIAAATGPKRHDVDLPPAEVVAY